MGRTPRRVLPKLRLAVEPLEARQMLSRSGIEHAEVLPVSAAALSGADELAWGLVHDPKMADRLGLTTLAGEIKYDMAHPAVANWAAALQAEMARHPGYASNAGLAAMIAAKGLGQSAWDLAHVPKLAGRLGVGALAGALRRDMKHQGMAFWGMALRSELGRHPGYAAEHGLTSLMAAADPVAAPSAATSVTDVGAVAPASSAATTSVTDVGASIPVPPSSTGVTAVSATPAAPATPVAPGPVAVPVATPIAAQPASTPVAVGGVLRLKVPAGGLSGKGLAYTISPQPLPANMTFNRATGALVFAPAPGQQGDYRFNVAVADGTNTVDRSVAISVTAPAVASTELSGRVVGQSNRPVAGVPVSIGAIATTTDADGNFTLTNLPANPGPLSVGGAVGSAEGRQDLTVPVAQVLGRDLYPAADNVLATPLYLPKIHWSAPSKVSATPTAGDSIVATNAAEPGFSLKLAAATAGVGPKGGKVQVAELGPKVAAQHEPDGVVGPLMLLKTTGMDLTRPTTLSLPNTSGLEPGATAGLLQFNPKTGGHDVIGQMVVSADGKSLVSTSPLVLATAASATTVARGKLHGGGSLEGGSGTGTIKAGGANAGEATPSARRREDGGGSLRGGSGHRAGGTPAITPFDSPGGSGSSSSSSGSSASSSMSASSGFSSSSTSSSFSTGHSSSSSTSGTGGPIYFRTAGFTACLAVKPSKPAATSKSTCETCQPCVNCTAPPANQAAAPINRDAPLMASNSGLVTGEYFLDHETVGYMSQGADNDVDLQYSSGQADPMPVVEGQFTTPVNGDSSSIRSVTAQATLGGVIQGAVVKFKTPTGLEDGETYDIPLQLDAASLSTGVYNYTIHVVEHFGRKKHKLSIPVDLTGHVNVVNRSQDAMGAGWSVGGLQQISGSGTGPVLVTAGQQGTERFDPTSASAPAYAQDLAIAGDATSAQVLDNDGAGDFVSGSPGWTGASSVGAAAGDLDGDGHPDMVVAGANALTILLDNGTGGSATPTTGGFTPGSTISLPSGDGSAIGVAVGNFSGHTDGVRDIAVLMSATGFGYPGVPDAKVVVYVGNGDGTFSTPVVTDTGIASSGTSTPTKLVVGDFNGDGKDDLAFAYDHAAEIMLSGSGGSFGSATALGLPSSHQAYALTSADYNKDGKTDLIVEANNTAVTESGDGFINLDLFTGSGSGTFAYTSTNLTTGHLDSTVLGLVAGDFNGAAAGLEVAVPLRGTDQYLDIVPLSTAGTWSVDTLITFGAKDSPGVLVSGDFNAAGKPSIALSSSNGIYLLAADPDSNQFQPAQEIPVANAGPSGNIPFLAVAPFDGQPNQAGYAGPKTDPSTLVHNAGGTWTQTYPDGTVLQYDAGGRETSEADRDGNTTTYAYVPAGMTAAGSLATITDPVGLVTTFTYASSGLSTITDPAGRVTTFTVDSHDNLTQVVDPDGAVEQYGYATPANHEATTETDPNNHTATAHYNAFGQLTSETLFDGTSTTSVDPAQSRGLYAPGSLGVLGGQFAGSVTDPDGHTTTLSFDWLGHPTGQVDADGGSETIIRDGRGFPVVVTDAMGRTTSYTYDASGNVTSITQPAPYLPGTWGAMSGGNVPTTETIAYGDPYGIPTSITDFDGNTTTFTLDSHGDVTRRTDPDGLHEDWTYNAAGQVLTDTDRGGHTTTMAYDSLGRVTTISYPGAGSPQSSIHYDSAGDVTSITDELGHTTTLTYDLAGRVLSSQDPIEAAAGHSTSYTYDADGNLLTVTDALGHVTSYAYNARDEVVGMTDPANQGTAHQSSYAYDARGNLTSTTDPNGHATTFAFDQDNRMVGKTDALGDHSTYAYNLDGEVTSVVNPNGSSVVYSYDQRGQLESIALPAVALAYAGIGPGGPIPIGGGPAPGGSSPDTGDMSEPIGYYTFTYDGDGDRLTVTDPLGETTTSTYNSIDQQVAVTDALGHATSVTYDADGDQATSTDALGHTTSYSYDARDRLVGETDPSGGGTTSYTYDLAGNLTSVTDPDDNVTSYTYDANDRESTETMPTGGVTTYTYDLAGDVTQKVDPLGRITQYGYDADDRERTEKWLPVGGGTAVYTMTMTYDAGGRVTDVRDDNSEYAYGYDNADRLTTVDDAGTPGLPQVTMTYGYDGNGQRTSLDDSLGGTVSYSYDVRNELANIVESGTTSSGVQPITVRMTYDQAGQMTALIRYVNGSLPFEVDEVARTTYAYDVADRLTGETTATPGGSTISSYAYTLDAADRLTQEVRSWDGGSSTDTATYGYTSNDQLTSVTHTNSSFASETFSYDSNGNRNATGYSTGTGNELSSDGTYNYTYDADGNLITKTSIATGVETVYTWDYRNRLTEVQQVSGGVTTTLAQYTYDALGNPIEVVEGGATRYTLYDGQTPLLDFNGSGTVTARYLSVPGAIDEVLARQTSSGVAWYLTDREGSVNDIINNSGTVIDHVDYSAYGTVMDESSLSNGDRFKYSGMELDAATGLNYDRARWYNPSSGTWIERDPLGLAAGDENLYRFVGNGPACNIDPMGLYADDPPPVKANGPKKPIFMPDGTTTLIAVIDSDDKGDPKNPKAVTGPIMLKCLVDVKNSGIRKDQIIEAEGIEKVIEAIKKATKGKKKSLDVIVIGDHGITAPETGKPTGIQEMGDDQLDPKNPDKLNQLVEYLKEGGTLILTGCDLFDSDSVVDWQNYANEHKINITGSASDVSYNTTIGVIGVWVKLKRGGKAPVIER